METRQENVLLVFLQLVLFFRKLFLKHCKHAHNKHAH